MLGDFNGINQIEDPIPSASSGKSAKKITSPKFGNDEERKEEEEHKQF